MEMGILLFTIIALGYAIVLIKDIQSDTSNLKLNISRAMQKIDNIIKKMKDGPANWKD
jgi:hypothetical protein|tara:strand:- start:121 stop:294 length:174 start_codon:yes stop_codon:yes gene_type:complete